MCPWSLSPSWVGSGSSSPSFLRRHPLPSTGGGRDDPRSVQGRTPSVLLRVLGSRRTHVIGRKVQLTRHGPPVLPSGPTHRSAGDTRPVAASVEGRPRPLPGPRHGCAVATVTATGPEGPTPWTGSGLLRVRGPAPEDVTPAGRSMEGPVPVTEIEVGHHSFPLPVGSIGATWEQG